jgi:nucleoside-diphosphate-sugar epimerase
LEQADYQRGKRLRRERPESEWEPFWEYGGHVDVRDVATAVEQALRVPLSGHHRALLCAAEIWGSASTLELVNRLAPSVPLRDPERYRTQPKRALLDCSVAERLFRWRPAYGASGRTAIDWPTN